MRKYFIILFLSISSFVYSQTVLNMEGQNYTNSDPAWTGIIPNFSIKTTFSFRNNSIICVNTGAHMLSAGNESPTSSDNNFDGEVISGNKITWNGSGVVETEALLLGYNKNHVVEYNYLDKTPYAAVFKSGNSSTGNMTSTTGGFAYNIVRNSQVHVRVKGMNGVPIFNNTFFDNNTPANAFIYISLNPDNGKAASTGTKIKNNIFYTTTGKGMIYAQEPGDLSGLVCDYNVYYSSTGSPRFYNGSSWLNFIQWQALGYDLHSVVLNPQFIDVTSLVPTARLNYGTDLGTSFQAGLSVKASWVVGSSPATTNQNGPWQVGAIIYDAVSAPPPPPPVAPAPVIGATVVENATPSLLEMTYDLALNATLIPAASAYTVTVNGVTASVSSVAITGSKVQLALATAIKYGDVVLVSYAKPVTNPLQSTAGGLAAAFSTRATTNNLVAPPPVTPPPVLPPVTPPVTPPPVTVPVTVTMNITPNHIHKVINISLSYTGTVFDGLTPELVRITDTTGNLVSEQLIDTGATSIKFPINLDSGIYKVLLLGNGVEMASQKVRVY